MQPFCLSADFERALKKLDKRQKEIILKKMQKIIENPEFGKPLHKPMQNYKSERAEKLRIIYTMKGESVIFAFLEHRQKAYR